MQAGNRGKPQHIGEVARMRKWLGRHPTVAEQRLLRNIVVRYWPGGTRLTHV